MLDTQSLCCASATSSMFHNCGMDALCYSHVDLTLVVPKVNNAVVSAMLQRDGESLMSLKLGIVPGPSAELEPSWLSVYKKTNPYKTCLGPLSGGCGTAGIRLKKLHLYNIDQMDSVSLCAAISACPFLLDLEIVGCRVKLSQTLVCVSENCHLIDRLFLEYSERGHIT